MTRPWRGVPTLDTSSTTWRGRALRYLLIYLLLLVALVSVRYLTRDVRDTLLAAGTQQEALVTRREELALDVQTLSNVQRVRDWAFANGMHRFAEAAKTSQPIPAGKARAVPAVLQSPRTVEVKIQWK